MLTIFAAAALALVLAETPAAAHHRHADGHDAAVDACLEINEYAPAELVEVVEDGMGDWLVWVEDKDGDLWMCNANAEGDVYANVFLEGDLLDGEGAELIGFEPTRHRRPNPAGPAERLCMAVGEQVEDMEIVATVEDGMGDYLVWLQNDDEDLWVCNASAEAKLYVFEAVDYPLEEAPEDRHEGDACTVTDERTA